MHDTEKLIQILPESLHSLIDNPDNLIEIVLDLGRPLTIRYYDRKVKHPEHIVTEQMLNLAMFKVGTFGSDNRAGMDKTLHRISQIKSRTGEVIGLTCRVGRVFDGSVTLIQDLITNGKSVLLVGKPGLGKTSLLRSTAKYLSDTLEKSVVIVDSSNEIAGDGVIPHPAVGDSRRLQVPLRSDQHDVMIEAVQNHTPDCIIIDEMGTEQEALAARTIAQRGVQLIATAHGRKLDDIMKNPTLLDLVGRPKAITVGDKRAEELGTNKTIFERELEPTFDVVVELVSYDEVCVYYNVAEAVDCILSDGFCRPERRRLIEGQIVVIEGYLARLPYREEKKEPEDKPRPRAKPARMTPARRGKNGH